MVKFCLDLIEQKRSGVILAPRGSAKTTWLTTILMSWLVSTNLNIRIGLISNTAKQSNAFSRSVRWTLEANSMQHEVFGNLKGPVKWNDVEWIAKDSALHGTKDVTMYSTGAGGAIISKRFDLILCHEKGTRIFDGSWVNVEDHPTARIQRRDGLEVFVWGLPFPEVVTPEHRYWAQQPEGAPGWVEANDLDRRSFIGCPIDQTVGPVQGIPVRVNRLASSGKSGIKNDWVYEIQDQPELHDRDWWWLLGLWWGDGHRARRTVGFTLSDEGLTSKLTSILDRYGYPWHREARNGCWQITFQSTRWAEWLTSWRSGNSMKQPPDWVERIDLRYQEALLRGYIDADGFVDHRQREVRITSVHLPGLLAARRMFARLQIPASIRLGPRAGTMEIDGRAHQARQRYDLRFHLRHGPRMGLRAPGATRWSESRNRVFIEDGFLWSKVRGLNEVSDREFVPIQTDDHTYLTAFGLSHNCDDILDEENTANIDQREKVENWFWKTLKPCLVPGGSIIVVGTRWADGDLYQQLIEDKKWPSILKQAVVYDPADKDQLYPKSYWPEVWPMENLNQEKLDMGAAMFACAYLNDISGLMEGNIFSRHWFKYFDSLPAGRRYTFKIGVDLASSEKQRADWTAAVTVAEDDIGNTYVLDVRRTKTETGHRQFVLDAYLRDPSHPISKIVIENNQFQSTLVAELLKTTTLPVVGKKSDVDKVTRARAVAARYEAGKVFHHRSLQGSDFEVEALSFPKGHDDMIDSLGNAMETGAKGAFWGSMSR